LTQCNYEDGNDLASVDVKCTVKIQAYGDKTGNNVKDRKLA